MKPSFSVWHFLFHFSQPWMLSLIQRVVALMQCTSGFSAAEHAAGHLNDKKNALKDISPLFTMFKK